MTWPARARLVSLYLIAVHICQVVLKVAPLRSAAMSYEHIRPGFWRRSLGRLGEPTPFTVLFEYLQHALNLPALRGCDGNCGVSR